MKKLCILSFSLFTLILLQGCTITQQVEPTNISSENELCIIEAPSVRESFLAELRTVLIERQIANKIVDQNSSINDCEWSATYMARWSWDLSLYMSYAEISIYHNGLLDGHALYDSTRGGGNMGKFIDAETKIRELVDELISQHDSSSL